MVEPVDPFQRGKFNRLEAAPWPTQVNNFGFVKPVDSLGEGVVVAIADTANRRFNPKLPLSVRCILSTNIGFPNFG